MAATAGALGLNAGEVFQNATVGDLYNNGEPVLVVVTDQRVLLVSPNGQMRVEQVPGVRCAVVGDYEGDGTQELLLLTDAHVWVVRFSSHGSVPSGKVALERVPDSLSRAPFTNDERTVLMETAADKVTFYVLHPARGLVQIASAPVDATA
jgi:hypothetical protein